LAYEYEDDIVVNLDGQDNGKNTNTVRISGGINSTPDGFFKNGAEVAHNIYKYSDAVKDYGAQGVNNLDPFINDLPKTTQYFELFLDTEGRAEYINPPASGGTSGASAKIF
jgi:hypothetical protein